MEAAMNNPLIHLRRLIVERYSLSELQTLCFDLGVNYDDLPGEALSDKARELILKMGRRRRLDQLLTVLAQSRPDLPRETILSTDPAALKALYAALPTFEARPRPDRRMAIMAIGLVALLAVVIAIVILVTQDGKEVEVDVTAQAKTATAKALATVQRATIAAATAEALAGANRATIEAATATAKALATAERATNEAATATTARRATSVAATATAAQRATNEAATATAAYQATSAAATATATWLGQDDDRDSLTNRQELELGTLPDKRDTDEDGLDDGDEVSRGTEPLTADTDGDGLWDGKEVSEGLNPLEADTDSDGAPDASDPEPDMATLTLSHEEWGSIYSDGDFDRVLLCAGDFDDNRGVRGFVSFDLSSIPAGASVVEATLELPQARGFDAGSTAGLLSFWIHNYQYGTLEAGDFDGGPTVRVGGYNSFPLPLVDVKDSVQTRISGGEDRFQLRLQFGKLTNDNSRADFICFGPPSLTITYRMILSK
jgi:hypothetical protein